MGVLYSIEIFIRFMLLRPLVQGAFLSDEWADILAKRVATGRTAEDRKILPAILKQWDIDITKIKTKKDNQLWETIKSLRKKRNDFVHAGKSIESLDSEGALDTINTLISDILLPIAEKLGFNLTETGKWCKIEHKTVGFSAKFTPLSPFED